MSRISPINECVSLLDDAARSVLSSKLAAMRAYAASRGRYQLSDAYEAFLRPLIDLRDVESLKPRPHEGVKNRRGRDHGGIFGERLIRPSMGV